ncbi:MAG: anthranilate synthase component I family protein [Pseudomonadota bacterium]
MPSDLHPPSRATCSLDTRDPAGRPLRLDASHPARVWRAGQAAGLPLTEALDLLTGRPGGLLVGVLPYPDPGSQPASGATPATLYLFDTCQRLDPAIAHPATTPGPAFRLTAPFTPDWPPAGYIAGVRRIQEYLAAGDAYQVNLAQRHSARYTGNPRQAYEHLRQHFQPPFAAWVDLGDRQILCLSPESFLEVNGRNVVTRPIKGTRPRHPDPVCDQWLADELRDHPKDRAENLMIVDLLRNDLGKVCLPGSVRAPVLFEVQTFRNVHHLVSTVTGTLADGSGPTELLQAAFPGGSITGAPKRRAMEIIRELEPHPRDIYCGTLFWALPDGSFGSNIMIRTFLARDGVIHGWAGAGIVADSDPEAEADECSHKLQPLMDVLGDLGK